MADDLKPRIATPQVDVARSSPFLPTRSAQDGAAAMRREMLPWMLIAALCVAVLWLAWRAFYYQEEGDPVASAMLAFEKQNSLVVFSSRFEVVADAVYEQNVGPVTLRRIKQATIIPASVEYRLDLSSMDAAQFAWDAETQTLSVTLPQLQTSRPNLDEAKARIFTEGLFNTGGSQQLLTKEAARIAEQRAQTFARNPEVLGLARNAARDAIRQNLAVPLQVAGFDRARVAVRFAAEDAIEAAPQPALPKPDSGAS